MDARLMTEDGEPLVTEAEEDNLVWWTGTIGGADSPRWGENVHVFVWAAIAAGSTMRWGESATDNLDSGNVLGGGVTDPAPPAGRLWVDLTCDTVSVETHIGGTRADGAIARAESATCTLALRDPHRIYDPLNPDSPYQYGNTTRLMPGVPIWVWAETFDDTAVSRWDIFRGTVDTWTEPWELHPSARTANVVASDAVKDLVNLDFGEQPATGTGDTVDHRIERVLTHYGWTGPTNLDPSTRTLQETTLAQSAWELIGRAADDDIGFVWIDASEVLQFRNRETWTTRPTPVLTVGCSPDVTDDYDVVIDADARAANLEIRNAVYAARTDGTQQNVRSEPSIAAYGLRSYKRTDLGLHDDSQVGAWATFVLSIAAYPRAHLDRVVMIPLFERNIWPTLLGLELITDRVRMLWRPPDSTSTVDTTGRVLGVDHSITHARWEVGINLAKADIFAHLLHWGHHADDRLDRGYTYA
jgi:hypothetical protein